MRALRWIGVGILWALSVTTTASAQEEEETGDAQEQASIERARDHMERGQTLYLQARFEEAASEFEAAYEARPFSAFLYNAAVALERAGQSARAAAMFERYLSEQPDADDAEAVRARVEQLRAAAQSRADEAARAAEGAAGPVAAGTDEGVAAGQRGEGSSASAEAASAETESAEAASAEAESAEAASAEAASAETESAEAEAADGEPPGGSVDVSEAGAQAEPGAPQGVTASAEVEGPAPAREPPPRAVPREFKSLLNVRTTPSGAIVSVRRGDEEVARGAAPFAHTLDAGRYRLVVEHPSYQTVEQDVRVEPGRVYVIIVEMSQGEFLGYLRVRSDVIGASVYIDDREQGPRGQTPFETPIPVGTHRVWVEQPGYQLRQAEAEVDIGDDVTLQLDLERVEFGRLRVASNVAGARVLVDGQQVGTVPFEGQLPAGPHRLRVEAEGMKAYEEEVAVARGRLTPVRAQLRPDVGRGGAWVAAVFSVLTAGGGVALALLGDERMTALQRDRDAGRLASDDPRLDEGLFMWIAADAAFGLAAIFGILSLYYFIYDPLPPSEGQVGEPRDWALAPMVDPVRGTAGLSLGGTF